MTMDTPFGGFTEAALAAYQKALEGKEGLDFSEGETYDFTRCVRADGSVYGTRGKCKKGKETGAKVEETVTVLKRPPEEIESQRKNDKLREGYIKNGQSGMIKAYDKNAELAEQIRRQDPKGHMEIISSYLQVDLSQKVAGFLVRTEVSKDNEGHTEIGYTVNGSFDAGKVKDRKDQVRVALAAKNQYQTVINSLKDGSVVVVYPNQEDGRGAAREKAYAKLGFVHDDEGDTMYGIVKNGKIVSPDIDDDFGYAEEKRGSEIEEVDIWIQLVYSCGKGGIIHV